MPTTASVIISDALKEIRVIGIDQTPGADQSADALRMLNRLMETFSNDADFAYSKSQVSLALTGQSSFTIGPTGDIISTRPIELSSATADLNGVTYPVRIVDVVLYDDIILKTLSGAVPQVIFYDGTYPNGTVYPYPLSSATIDIRVINIVKSFAALTTQLDMPPGYEDYIMLALAIRLAPGYNKEVNPDTKAAYLRAKGLVERNNVYIPTLSLPNGLSGRRGGSSYASFMAGE